MGSDLDDTLHHFRLASKQAAEAVFLRLQNIHNIPQAQLNSTYREILKRSQSNHFLDGRSSNEYRAERFRSLLSAFQVDRPDDVEMLVREYATALGANLKSKDGAEELLGDLKRQGNRLVVITEGPHDAQEWTLQRLGLSGYVDLLVTSSRERTSKTDRLFHRALEQMACAPNGLIYIGDSLERDVLPARALGIEAFLLAENGHPGADVPMVPSLREFGRAVDRWNPSENL